MQRSIRCTVGGNRSFDHAEQRSLTRSLMDWIACSEHSGIIRMAGFVSRTDDIEHNQTHRVQKIFSSGNFFVDIKLALGNNPALFCWVMAS